MSVPFRYNFRSLSKKIPYDFLKFNFSNFTPYVRLIFLKEANLKFSDSKMRQRGIRKILTFAKRSTASKFFGKILNTEALVISKSLKFPKDDRTDTNFIAPLRMHFQRSKSTLDSLKRLFNAFRRKLSLVAPENGRTKPRCNRT